MVDDRGAVAVAPGDSGAAGLPRPDVRGDRRDLGGYAAWEVWTSDEPLVGKLVVFGGWTGFGLLFLGVLLDRLKAMKTDRYREVEK